MDKLEHDETCLEKKPLCWSIKTINLSLKEIRLVFYYCFGMPVLWINGATWWLWERMDTRFDFWLTLCMVGIIAPLIFLAILRQKTVFNYKIHSDHGEVEHQLYFPDFAGSFFQGMAVLAILVFGGAAIFTGSLLFLFGPAAMALGSAMQLMNWEKPPVEHEKSLPWHEYGFVTVDRKYRVIVTHCTDLTFGFEARFPDKELFEHYLAFLHTALPPHAEFIEKVWEW